MGHFVIAKYCAAYMPIGLSDYIRVYNVLVPRLCIMLYIYIYIYGLHFEAHSIYIEYKIIGPEIYVNEGSGTSSPPCGSGVTDVSGF